MDSELCPKLPVADQQVAKQQVAKKSLEIHLKRIDEVRFNNHIPFRILFFRPQDGNEQLHE